MESFRCWASGLWGQSFGYLLDVKSRGNRTRGWYVEHCRWQGFARMSGLRAFVDTILGPIGVSESLSTGRPGSEGIMRALHSKQHRESRQWRESVFSAFTMYPTAFGRLRFDRSVRLKVLDGAKAFRLIRRIFCYLVCLHRTRSLMLEGHELSGHRQIARLPWPSTVSR